VMDKKLIEKYLKEYPDYEKEIERCETEQKDLESKYLKYSSASYNNSNYAKNMLATVEETLNDIAQELKKLYAVEMTIRRMNRIQRKIAKLRFCEGKSWDDIAKELKFSKGYVQRVYKNAFSEVVH
jgi:DNA-directed RNA polymerase specialized sigma subunit